MKEIGKTVVLKEDDEEELLSLRVQEAAEDGYVLSKIVRQDKYVVLYFEEA